MKVSEWYKDLPDGIWSNKKKSQPAQPIGYTGAGSDGVVQPNKAAHMMHTPNGPVMVHEGEATVQGPNGVQVVPQAQLQKMNDKVPGMATGGIIPSFPNTVTNPIPKPDTVSQSTPPTIGTKTPAFMMPTNDQINQGKTDLVQNTADKLVNAANPVSNIFDPVGKTDKPAPITMAPKTPGTIVQPETVIQPAPSETADPITMADKGTPVAPPPAVPTDRGVGMDIMTQFAKGEGPQFDAMVNRAIQVNGGSGAALTAALKQEGAQMGYSPEQMGAMLQMRARDIAGENSKLAGELAAAGRDLQLQAAQSLAPMEKAWSDTEFGRKADAATTALQNGDYGTFNEFLTSNGLPAVDFSKAEAGELFGIASSIGDVIGNLPDNAPPEIVTTLSGLWSGVMGEGWKKAGIETAVPGFQAAMDAIQNAEPEVDPENWWEFTRFANTEIGSWINSTEGQNFMGDLADNPATAGLIDDVLAINEMDPDDVTSDLEGKAEEVGGIVGAYWAMLYGGDNFSDAQRSILKKYGLYDEEKDAQFQSRKSEYETEIQTNADNGLFTYDALSDEAKEYISEEDYNRQTGPLIASFVNEIFDGTKTLPGNLTSDDPLYRAVINDSRTKSGVGDRSEAVRGLPASQERAYFGTFETYDQDEGFTEIAVGTPIYGIGDSNMLYVYDGKQIIDKAGNDHVRYFLRDPLTGKRYYVEAANTDRQTINTPVEA